MSEQKIDHPQAKRGGCGCGKGVPAGVASVLDPVCGMKVDPVTSKHRHEHDGVAYHFCCGGCRAKFAADPDGYLKPKAAELGKPGAI